MIYFLLCLLNLFICISLTLFWKETWLPPVSVQLTWQRDDKQKLWLCRLAIFVASLTGNFLSQNICRKLQYIWLLCSFLLFPKASCVKNAGNLFCSHLHFCSCSRSWQQEKVLDQNKEGKDLFGGKRKTQSQPRGRFWVRLRNGVST